LQKVKLMVIAVETVLILMIIVNTFLLAQCHLEEDSEDRLVALVDHMVALVDHSVALVDHMVALVDRSVALVDHSVVLVDQMLVLEEHAVVSEDHMVGKALATHTCAESTYIIIILLISNFISLILKL
jgi:hypothetical protein